jgi:hypothetical protein
MFGMIGSFPKNFTHTGPYQQQTYARLQKWQPPLEPELRSCFDRSNISKEKADAFRL